MKTLLTLVPVVLVLFIIFPNDAKAQANVDEIKSEDFSTVFNTSGYIKTKSSTNTTGSPYLNEDFLKGHILLNNNSKTGTLPIRFNIQENYLEFVRNDEILIAEINQINAFKIYAQPNDVTFKKGYETNVDNISNDTFLRSVHTGKLILLARHSVNLIEDVPNYSSATTNDKYTRSVNYYLITPDGTFNKIQDPKEDFLNLLSEKESVLDYADSKNLNFNNESDLIKLLKYHQELQ